MVNSGSIPDIFLNLINMELVSYVLGDLFHFIGFIIILYVVFEGIALVVRAFKE